MRRALVLSLALLLLVLGSPGLGLRETQPVKNSTLSQGLLTISRSWTANIIVVGYDPALIDEVLLLQGMPTTRNYLTDDVEITYNISYNIAYADTAYLNALRQVMLDNSINGTETGTRLNETALSYQKSHLDEPQRIFSPRDGRVIDGYAIEDWLEANPYLPPPDLGYTLYLVNFSEFDSGDHTLEHWYDYHPVDPDTGEEQNWFRLEWDNALNPNVTMDYPFFGGRYNTYFVDPSAHQWYLKWCRIWWSEEITTEYDFWTQDLEQKVATLNLENPSDIDALTVYLSECIWDPINQLFFPYQHQPASYVVSGTLKGLVFCMDVASGTSVESLEWVTDAEMQKAHLEELYPFIRWNVDIEYIDIDTEPSWKSLFWTYAYIDTDGTTIVDGYSMFDAIRNLKRPQYVANDDNINVFGVVFIKKQMEMYADGRTYTGLGGGGQTVIWKSWERYYRPDEFTPKDGVSGVQLHETMHAIGFHHTWQHDHYSSDFSWSPMGYFTTHNGTASFDKNWVQGTYLDQMESLLWADFLEDQAALGGDERPETYFAEARAQACFENAREYYEEMNWAAAYEALSQAGNWTKRMMYSTHDDTPPLIMDRGTNPDEFGNGPFTYWAVISDDLAGLENVTLYAQVDEGITHVYPMSYKSGNWSVSIPYLPHTTNLTLWVVAWDWGMNMAIGGKIVDYIEPTPTPTLPPANLVITIVIIASVAGVVIVIGVFIIRRQE
jgi:hypothetical protein